MWTAIFTGVLSVFTYFLWTVAKSTDETSRASERAFLNFSQLGLGVKLIGADARWAGQEFSLNWTNSGNTPASDVVIDAGAQAWRTDLPPGYNFPENRANTLSVVGPKGVYGTIATVSNVDLMDSWSGRSRIFFWGSVVYKDIFREDPDRLSEFCIEMTHVTFATGAPPQSQTVQRVPTTPSTAAGIVAPTSDTMTAFQWQACREHNCYDQGCADYTQRVKDARGAK